jgi:polyvinyl alcohol dehydrogenase (cytochrome)
MKPKWVFTMNGSQGESATPTVADGVVYFPDWNGYLFAVSRGDGRLLWSTQVDTNPAAIITSNAVAMGNEVVVGVASNEEADAEAASYPCCSFRGAVVALNAVTGRLMWKTYMVPSNSPAGGDTNIPCASPNGPHGCGYTGGAVWATPTIDPLTNQVFVGTGNNYTTPDAAEACATADQNASPPVEDANCTPPNDYFDSVVALNLLTGQIEWGHKVQGYDAWNVACLVGEQPGATWCPAPGSPDFDFGGSSPNLFIGKGSDGKLTTLVGDGQKSGIYWAFEPSNGNIVWDTLVGLGSSLGGIEWGSAYDGLRIYTTEANPDLGGPPNTYTLCCGGGTASGGSWAALNPLTGWVVASVCAPRPLERRAGGSAKRDRKETWWPHKQRFPWSTRSASCLSAWTQWILTRSARWSTTRFRASMRSREGGCADGRRSRGTSLSSKTPSQTCALG